MSLSLSMGRRWDASIRFTASYALKYAGFKSAHFTRSWKMGQSTEFENPA